MSAGLAFNIAHTAVLAMDCQTRILVLFGIATSGVVLSTLLHACDADYRVVVIADCCVDLDAQLHDALPQRFFPSRGVVRRRRVHPVSAAGVGRGGPRRC